MPYPVSLRRIDHIRFFVGNARQSAYFYRNAFGFEVIAYAGLETRQKHEAGYVLRQGNITFVLASPLSADHPENRRLVQHGDGVQDIALEVDDVRGTFDEVVRRGAAAVQPPQALEDDFGVYRMRQPSAPTATRCTPSSIATATRASSPRAICRSTPNATARPRFNPSAWPASTTSSATSRKARWIKWVDFYKNVLGFEQLVHFDDKDISTEYSALMSKVVQNGTGRIKFPLNEPAKAKRRSQIDEFLQFYGGPGVQHIALATGNIMETVRAMRHNDVSFLRVPQFVLRNAARARRPHQGGHRRAGRAGHPRRPRRRRLHAANLHQAGRRSSDAVLRGDPATRLEELRQGQLQGSVRGDRTRTGDSRYAVGGLEICSGA